MRPRVDQIEVTKAAPPDEVRERLRLPDGEQVVVRSRRYLADERPVETAVSYLPLRVAEGTAITEVNTGPGGIYARLEEAGHELGHFTEEVTARMPTADERRRLELADGVPVLVVVRTAYDTAGQPARGLRHRQGCARLRPGVRHPRSLRSEHRLGTPLPARLDVLYGGPLT